MLDRRFVVDFRPAMRPLACFVTSAFLLSTSPLHAASADDDETSSTGGDSESSSSGETALPPAFTAPSLEKLAFDAPALGTSPFGSGAVGTAALGTKTFRSVGNFSLVAGASASVAAPTTPPATSAAAPVDPPPPKDDGAGLRTAGYIAGGVGIAGFILFAIAGIGAKNAHDRLEENCGSGSCDEATRQSDIEDGKTLQTAANIGLATGLTGLGLGATLILLGGRPPNDNTPTSTVSGTGAMITYGSRF
jgi:hypothetical protein